MKRMGCGVTKQDKVRDQQRNVCCCDLDELADIVPVVTDENDFKGSAVMGEMNLDEAHIGRR